VEGWHQNATRSTKDWLKKYLKNTRATCTSVMTYIRTKHRYALLRSTLAAIQGFQGKWSDIHL